MKSKSKQHLLNLLSIIVGVLPIYLFIIIIKIVGENKPSIFDVLGWQLIISVFGIFIIIVLNKYLLKKRLADFSPQRAPFLLDLSVAFLLLISIYLIHSISALTFYKWIIVAEANNSWLFELMNAIFANPSYTILFFGPVIWIGQIFLELSRSFLLKCLWSFSNNKLWNWTAIIVSAAFISLLNIDSGAPSVLSGFLISLLFNTAYFQYRRISPLIIASILSQTISLLGFVFH